MIDDFSNFKSAIDWPEDREPEEAPTGQFRPFSVALSKAIETVAETFSIAAVTESPIESIFGAKFALALRPLCKDIGWNFTVGTGDADIVLHPQYVLGRFRYDFAVLANGRAKPVLLIECDGKEFHSTEGQRANDRLKDAAASNAGMRLIRFSGSEINSDIDSCVTYALTACLGAVFQ
jgi:hypothetical protein